MTPADLPTEQALERVKVGGVIRCKYSNMRNPVFHRKFFALLNVGFDLWEPPPIDTRYGKPEKDFNHYRKQVTVLAGFYDTVFNLDGTFRLVAKSIRFDRMDEEEFGRVYSNTINVILKNIPDTYSREDINDAVERILLFA